MRRTKTQAIVGVLLLLALPASLVAQATGKPPSSYNPQEREAVEVVQGWISAWRTYDLTKLMSYMADDLIFRADPSEPLQNGRDGFERIARGVMNGWCGMDLEEVFVVGGEADTVALFKRIDYFPGNPAPGRGPGGLTGLAVPVAVMFRVKNGKITEWLDAPLIPVGPGAPPLPGSPARGGPPPGGRPGGPGRGATPPPPPRPCIG